MRHEAAILDAVAFVGRPAAIGHVDLHNFKPLNAILGHVRGDHILASVLAGLEELGPTWRTGGDSFVVLLPGDLARAHERLAGFSWLHRVVLGATEAWRFRFADGGESPPLPFRAFEVVCTPRCGVAEIEGADGAAALALAEQRCEDVRREPSLLPAGYAPIRHGHWTHEVRLAEPKCPSCGHAPPIVLGSDLGWSKERCPSCAATYERTDRLFLVGDETDSAYA